jgi:hypothetical protein
MAIAIVKDISAILIFWLAHTYSFAPSAMSQRERKLMVDKPETKLSEWIINCPRLTSREEIAEKVVQLEADNAALQVCIDYLTTDDAPCPCGREGSLDHDELCWPRNTALQRQVDEYELLKRAVNENSGECLSDCDSYGHAEGCEYVSMSATMIIQQRQVERLEVLEAVAKEWHQRKKAYDTNKSLGTAQSLTQQEDTLFKTLGTGGDDGQQKVGN